MDTRRLKAVMVINGDTNADLAKALGITPSTLSRKSNGTDGADFNQTEIATIKARYSLTPKEIDAIFFADDVSQK